MRSCPVIIGRIILFSSIIQISFLAAQDNPAIPDSEIRRIPIDEGRSEFATEMTVLRPDDNTAVAAWKAYQNGSEKILARRIDLKTGNLDLVFELNEHPGVFAHLTGWARETIEDSSSSRFVWSEWNPKTTKWNVAAHRFQNGHFPNGVIYEKRLAGLRPSYLFSPIAAQELTDDQKSEINFNPSSGFQPENHNQYNISGGLTFRPVISRRGNSY